MNTVNHLQKTGQELKVERGMIDSSQEKFFLFLLKVVLSAFGVQVGKNVTVYKCYLSCLSV